MTNPLRMLLTLSVPEQEAGMRLDSWLASRLVDLDLPGVRRAISDGRVLIAGEPCTDPGTRLGADDQVGYEPSEEEAPTRKTASAELPMDIIDEGKHFVALAKKAGQHVIGARAQQLGQTLAVRFGSAAERGQPRRAGIVCGPDPDASGVVLLARVYKAHQYMLGALEAGAIERLCLAIVHGVELEDEGTFESPIGPHPTRRRQYTGSSIRGREASTRYTVWSRHEGMSLVQLKSTTWRPHQMRVHLAESGHPIAGDRVYGGKALPDLNRLALHCAAVGFVDPTKKEPVTYEAPLPREIAAAIGRLFPKAELSEPSD